MMSYWNNNEKKKKNLPASWAPVHGGDKGGAGNAGSIGILLGWPFVVVVVDLTVD